MKIELLHIEQCPNTQVALDHARAALDALGQPQVEVQLVEVRTEGQAAALAFGGSPTLLADGVDLFPTTPVHSLACRVYATEQGMAGAPSQRQIESALRGLGIRAEDDRP